MGSIFSKEGMYVRYIEAQKTSEELKGVLEYLQGVSVKAKGDSKDRLEYYTHILKKAYESYEWLWSNGYNQEIVIFKHEADNAVLRTEIADLKMQIEKLNKIIENI